MEIGKDFCLKGTVEGFFRILEGISVVHSQQILLEFFGDFFGC